MLRPVKKMTTAPSQLPMNRRSVLTAAVAALGLAAAGCGALPATSGGAAPTNGATDDLLRQAEALNGQDRTDFLLQRAKAEPGPLRFYVSYYPELLDKIVQKFEQTYGLKIESYRAAPEDIVSRIEQEAAARFPRGADLVETRGFELYRLSQAGLIRSFNGEFLDKVPDYGRYDDWTADRFNIIVPSWNTNLVRPDQVPRSWDDLADPRWMGQLAMEQLDYDWYRTMYVWMQSKGRSDTDIDDYFRRLAANSRVVQGHSQMQTALVAGQYAVAVSSYTYITEQQRAAGAPVAWQPAVQPAVAQPVGVALMKQANNPASAALFYAWILTDGQKVLADLGNAPSTVSIGAQVIPTDVQAFAADAASWTRRYDELHRGVN